MTKKLYVDMDGTLCRFHDENYLERMSDKDFFFNLKPFAEAVAGIRKVIYNADAEVYILSSVISSVCAEEKKKWLRKYLPELKTNHVLFVPVGENKSRHLDINCKAFLLDDYNKNLEEAKSLIPIKAVNNINDLGKVGRIWEGYRAHVCSKGFYNELINILGA